MVKYKWKAFKLIKLKINPTCRNRTSDLEIICQRLQSPALPTELRSVVDNPKYISVSLLVLFPNLQTGEQNHRSKNIANQITNHLKLISPVSYVTNKTNRHSFFLSITYSLYELWSNHNTYNLPTGLTQTEYTRPV